MYSINLDKLELHFSVWFWVRGCHREISMRFGGQKHATTALGRWIQGIRLLAGRAHVDHQLALGFCNTCWFPCLRLSESWAGPTCSSAARTPASSAEHCRLGMPCTERQMHVAVCPCGFLFALIASTLSLFFSTLHSAFLLIISWLPLDYLLYWHTPDLVRCRSSGLP